MLGDPPKVTQFVTDRGGLRLGLTTLGLAVCPASLPKAHLSKTPSALDKSHYVSPVQGHVSLGTSGHFVQQPGERRALMQGVSLHPPERGLGCVVWSTQPWALMASASR